MKSIEKVLEELYEEIHKPISELAIREAPVKLLIVEIFKLEALLEIRDELRCLNTNKKEAKSR